MDHYTNNIFYPKFLNHNFDTSGKWISLDIFIQSEHAMTSWLPALSSEWGRLAQGNNSGVESTDTIKFISFDQVPPTKQVTYASFACNHYPLKTEQWHICIVAGGDKLTYEFDFSSPAADMVETKILLTVLSQIQNMGLVSVIWILKIYFFISSCFTQSS